MYKYSKMFVCPNKITEFLKYICFLIKLPVQTGVLFSFLFHFYFHYIFWQYNKNNKSLLLIGLLLIFEIIKKKSDINTLRFQELHINI